MSGLLAAIRRKQRGIDDLVILEKGDGVGGTWRDNAYPGCACDVPSHLYSYSFAPNPRWSRMFAGQPEILAYFERQAAAHGLDRDVRLDTEVTDARFDPADNRWTVTAADGRARSEEHTSELQSLVRISYDVFCLNTHQPTL